MGVDKVHFGNQADDQMATTEPTGDMSKPELINFINNQHGVDFDTLQVQVVPGRRKNQFLKASTLIFSLARLFHPQAVLLPIQAKYVVLFQMTIVLCMVVHQNPARNTC
jgi:hypothetical protein